MPVPLTISLLLRLSNELDALFHLVLFLYTSCIRPGMRFKSTERLNQGSIETTMISVPHKLRLLLTPDCLVLGFVLVRICCYLA